MSIYIIAEIGFNHGGNIDLACQMINSAASCGANAVKFQSFLASDICFEGSEHYDLIRSGELTKDDHIILQKCAAESGVDFLSTPFSLDWVDFLDSIGVPAFKIASMDMNFYPLLEKIACTRKPVYFSTGTSSLEEAKKAFGMLSGTGISEITVMHCVSNYPTRPEDAQLNRIQQLKNTIGCQVGLSDHSLGIAVPIAAVALGAKVIEKHFTTDKNLPGPDHKISADPPELRQLIENIAIVEKALSLTESREQRPDAQNKTAIRRGIYANDIIRKKQIISMDMLKFVRPEITPLEKLPEILGKTATVEIPAGFPVDPSKLS